MRGLWEMWPPLLWLQDDGIEERVTELQQVVISLRYEALAVTHPHQRSRILFRYCLDHCLLRTISHRIWTVIYHALEHQLSRITSKECQSVALLCCDAPHTHKNPKCDFHYITASIAGFNEQFPKEFLTDCTVVWLWRVRRHALLSNHSGSLFHWIWRYSCYTRDREYFFT